MSKGRENMKYAYKWLRPGRVSPIVNFKWPVKVGEWTPRENPVICSSGWHAMEEKNVLGHLPTGTDAELWWIAYDGVPVIGDDKFAVDRMKLVERVGIATKKNLRLFAADCAEDALSLIENPDPRSVAAIDVARRFANGEATQKELDAAGAAAWAAAWSAAEAAAGDAARDAARAAARNAARDAAWNAARDAARAAARYAAGVGAGGAAWNAARDAAWNAARDAARDKYSNWLVVRLESGY